MCKADKYLDEFKKMSKEIEGEYNRLCNLQARYDKELSDMYHSLEVRKNFNAAEGYYIAKDMQKLLRKRRLVKHERDYYASIKQTLDLGNFYPKVERACKNLDSLKNKNHKYTSDWSIESNQSDFQATH